MLQPNLDTDALPVAELGDAILAELRKVNENLTQLCLVVRSNSGSKPATNAAWGSPGSPMPGVEYRTSLAMEQLRRRPATSADDQVEAVRVPSPTEPRGKPETRAWGLEIGETDLVLDDHRQGT